MNEFEKKCYGISEKQIKQQYMSRSDLLEMTVMGLLSDCQELIGGATMKSATSETLRKQLNIAKYILSEMIDQRMERV